MEALNGRSTTGNQEQENFKMLKISRISGATKKSLNEISPNKLLRFGHPLAGVKSKGKDKGTEHKLRMQFLG